MMSFILVITLLGCQKDTVEPAIYRVPPELEVYVQRFLQEAKLRNLEIEINNLIIEYGTLDSSHYDGSVVCAACRQVLNNPQQQKRIIINTTVDCWKTLSDRGREVLIFHELGHCILQRIEHTDTKLPNGDFASIMNGRTAILYEPCIYDIGNGPCDKIFKRQYYMDELFDPKTPVPAWAK